MITLHHLDNSRSQRIIWLLEELDIAYDIQFYSRDPQTRRAPPALTAVHPLGKSPILTDGATTLAESSLIAEYLCETYDDGPLSPTKSQEADRPAQLYWRYWIHYSEASFMAPLLMKLLLSPLSEPALIPLKTDFVDYQLGRHLEYCETSLKETGWFAGAHFTAADIMMSFPLEASAKFGLIHEDSECHAFLARIQSRPAYQQALIRGRAAG